MTKGPTARIVVGSTNFSQHFLRSPMRRRRRRRITLIAIAAVLFLAISAFLARYLSTDNVERDADLALLQAEARGDAHGLIARIHGCAADPGCVTLQRSNAARLRRPGPVKILQLISATANAPSTTTGTTRIAWTVIGRLPVVQCIRVHRSGNALTGMSVTLLALSAPIANTGVCPSS